MFLKILLLTFLVLFPSVVFPQANIISPDYIRTYKQFKNYIINPDAEKNVTTGITNASSIVTRDTNVSSVINGAASFSINATASGQYVKFKLNTLPNKFIGQGGECTVYHLGNVVLGDYKWYVEDTSGTKISAQYNMPATISSTGKLDVFFNVGSALNGPYYLVVESTANGDDFRVDDIYCGDITSIGQFADQSEKVDIGVVALSATGTALAKGTTTVDASHYYRDGKYMVYSAQLQTTGAGSPATGTGEYRITLPSGFTADTNIVQALGTTLGTGGSAVANAKSRLEGGGWISQSTSRGTLEAFLISSTTIGFVVYNNFTDIQPFGASAYALAGGATAFQVTVRIPIAGWSASQSAAAANQTDYGWRSYTPASYQGIGTPSSVECLESRVSENLLVQCKLVTGTVSANEMRVALPTGLTSAGTSKIPSIRVAGVVTRSGTGANSSYVLIEPSVTYFTFGVQNNSFAGQTKRNGSDIFGTGDTVGFQAIIPIAGWEPNQRAPTLIGSVTSNSVGALRIESASVSAAGVPTEIGGSDWINGNCAITDTSLFTCTLNSGFSSAPTCFVTPIDSGTSNDLNARLSAIPTTTSAVIRTNRSSDSTSFTKEAQPFSLLCFGPR